MERWKQMLQGLTVLAFLHVPFVHAGSPIQTVTNVNDSGPGSLRAAINAANANGVGGAIITFDIGSSCGPRIIQLLTPLPELQQEVHVLGYNQPGASPNSMPAGILEDNAVLCIILDGASSGIADGFIVPAGVADAVKAEISGIAFSGFSHAAINLRGGSHHVVIGVRTGGTFENYALQTGGYGVILAAGVHDAQIGGDSAERNVFAGLQQNAVYIASSNGVSSAAHDNTVSNNVMGVVNDGVNSTPAANLGSNIAIGGYGNTIFLNFLYYSGSSGLHLSNQDCYANLLSANFTAYSFGDGILVDDGAHSNTMLYNVVFDNGGAGVRVINGRANSIRRNGLFDNTSLGIDLAGAGVTVNDNDSTPPSPDYANRGQNFPVINSASGGHHAGNVTFTLTSTPGDYDIDITALSYCDGSGYGEGDVGLSYRNQVTGRVTLPLVVDNGQSTATFTLPVTTHSMVFGNGTSITATATDAAGNTSEFSACVPYSDDGIFDDDFEVHE